MHQAVQFGQPTGIAENDPSQSLPVDRPIHAHDIRAESADHLPIHWVSGLQQSMAYTVGVYHRPGPAGQKTGYGGFAAAHTSRNTDHQLIF
jgi:hypothetical protein